MRGYISVFQRCTYTGADNLKGVWKIKKIPVHERPDDGASTTHRDIPSVHFLVHVEYITYVEQLFEREYAVFGVIYSD